MSSWTVSMSNHARLVENPIRNLSDNTKPSPCPKPVLKLSIGDPTLDKNLLTPSVHVEKLKEVINSNEWNGYAPSVGSLETREAVATWWSNSFVHNEQLKRFVVKENVVVSSGGSHAILMAITAICDKGDYALIPKPGFPHYETVCKAYGIGMHFYNCLPDKNWEVDLEEVRRLKDDKTKLMVLTNPSNPCGSNFSRKHVEDIVRLAEELQLPLFCDEIYAGMVFNGEVFTSVADIDTCVPRVILGGTAKNLVVPGWRLGWLLLVDPEDKAREYIAALHKVSALICGPNTLAQGALSGALFNTSQEYFKKNMQQIEENSMYVYKHLGECVGLTPTMPQGSMYVLTGLDVSQFSDIKDDVEFYEKLLEEENVQLVPGGIFRAPGFLRVVTTRPISIYCEAIERIKGFCERHSVVGEKKSLSQK